MKPPKKIVVKAEQAINKSCQFDVEVKLKGVFLYKLRAKLSLWIFNYAAKLLCANVNMTIKNKP